MPDKQRLFFALWPDAELQDQIHQQLKHTVSQADGRWVVAANLHITLAFIGLADAGLRECLVHAASQVQANAFELQLSDLGFWRRPQVLWLGTEVSPPPLQELLAELNTHLSTCGYQPDKRVFVPHMTFMRKVKRDIPTKNIQPFEWRVDRFVLVHSQSRPGGVHYEVIEQWPLRRV